MKALHNIDLTAGTTAAQEVAQLVTHFLLDCQALLLEELLLGVNFSSFEFLQGILCLQTDVLVRLQQGQHILSALLQHLSQQCLAGHEISTTQSALHSETLEVTRCSFTCAQLFKHLADQTTWQSCGYTLEVITHNTQKRGRATFPIISAAC